MINKVVLAGSGSGLRRFVKYAGPHPWENEGWQIVLDFGEVQVSIACTPWTTGVELMAWGLFVKPLKNVTPAMALNVLKHLMEV